MRAALFVGLVVLAGCDPSRETPTASNPSADPRMKDDRPPLERARDVPEDKPGDKVSMQKIELKDVKDRIFEVTAKMEGERVVLKLGAPGALKEVNPERLFEEMQTVIKTTGRREMWLDIERDVPWGIETAILNAAKANKILNIINNQRPKR
jgi:hypothetical protein